MAAEKPEEWPAKMTKAQDKENLWLDILNEQKGAARRLVSNKSVIVFGDNGTGKTSLLAKLNGKKSPEYGVSLEYDYIDVRDDINGDKAQLGVWTINGDIGHTNLLPVVFNEDNFGDVLVMLTVSITEPWAWPKQLKHWVNVLERHIESLPLAAEKKVQARERLATIWQSYGYTGSCLKQAIAADDLSPLTEDALTTNLGVDLVVVVTKTDCMGGTFLKENDYCDEHIDFMQHWIRNFCLRHGAALFYTSIKKATNCDHLRKYLLHRIYGLPFQTPPMVVNEDAVLIPAGWDTLRKIDILFESIHGIKANSDYTDIIKAPSTGNVIFNRNLEFVETVDEQAFLAHQMEILKLLDQSKAKEGGDGIHCTRQSFTGQSSSMKTEHYDSPDRVTILSKFFAELREKKSESPSGDGPVSVSSRNAIEKLGISLQPGAELGPLSRIAEKKEDQVKPE
ncbi:cytoplasmic dynein 1 light intermediate chain 2 [Drosophila persimilis]|nr:cytoplasmic dynein 1 light intermediate chain 2 [Drosophila persimilis]